jgi:hypothetical protein
MQAGLFSGLKNAFKGDVPDVSDATDAAKSAADAVKANVPNSAKSAVSAASDAAKNVADAVPNPSEAKARILEETAVCNMRAALVSR